MKILLVNPVNPNSAYFANLVFRVPYLGVYHLKRLTPENVEAGIWDETVQAFDMDSLHELPDVAAVSVNFTAAAKRGYEIADALRNAGVHVIIGGNHATYCTEEALRHADSVVQGEADEIWPGIVADAEAGRLARVYTAPRLPDLAGIIFPRRRNPVLDIPSLDLSALADLGGAEGHGRAEVLRHALRQDPGPLSRLLGALQGRLAAMAMEGSFDFLLRSRLTAPRVRDLLHNLIGQRLYAFLKENREAVIQAVSGPLGGYLVKKILQVGRGCPVDCEFCSVTAFNGKRYRHYKIDQLVADIAELAGDGRGIDRFIVFADDNIVADPRFAKEFFRAIKPLKIHWWSQATIQMARDPELLKLAAESGCVGVFYGFETLKQDTLKAVDKGFKVKDYIEVIQRTHDAGIAVFTGAFVFGLPGDTWQDIEQTVRFCIEQGIDFPQYSIATPLPGTRLWKRLYGDSLPSEENWDHYTYTSCTDPVLAYATAMSSEELNEAWKQAYMVATDPEAVSRRLSQTAFRTVFMMAGTYFANHLFSVFSETGYWDRLNNGRKQEFAMLG